MALRINTNVTALNTHKNLVINDERLSGSVEKLSSGLRINRAADDAAGLTIAEKLRTQVRGINRAILNVQDGISMIQTAEGALNETHSMLQRMRELAIQASNDTLTTTDRLEIQKEIAQLKEDINRIAYGTEFNTKKLLDGSGTAAISTSDPTNLEGVPTGEVLTFSDFSVVVYPQVVTLPDGTTKTMRGTSQVSRSAFFTRTDGILASGSTTLQSITNFYDKNGNFILEIPQTMYLQGDNHQGKLTVSKDLTLDQLASRMQDAATQDQLGVGLHFDGSTATFSDAGDTNGQIILTSGKRGNIGRMNVTGEQNLITALGFQEVILAEDPVYSIGATDIGPTVTTRTTRTMQIAGARAAGLIQGVDLIFQPPTEAFVSTKPADLGITISAGTIVFDVDDGDPVTNPVTVTVLSGSWSMNQIASLINDQLSIAGGPKVRVQLNDSYALQFYSQDTGSSGYMSIYNLNAFPNRLGIATGKRTGTGGVAGSLTGSAAVGNFDFSAANEQFTVTDAHGNPPVTVTLAGNYTGGTMTSLVDAINLQLAATPTNLIRAFNSNGFLELRSLETGPYSNFTYTDGAPAPVSLNIANGLTSVSGAGGNIARQDYAFDQSWTGYGFAVVSGTGAPDNLVFNIGDLDGSSANVTISAGTIAAGDTFRFLNTIVSIINGTTVPTVKVQSEIDDTTHTIRFFSTVPGKTGKVAIAELSNAVSVNNLRSVFDVAPQTYQNGVGDYAFTMHVKDQFIQFQVGPNEGHFAKANMVRADTIALGVNDLDLTNIRDAQKAIGLLDKALQYVSSERAKLGAIENRMTYTSTSLRVALENMSASESRIRDIDMAAETINLTKFQIMQQAGTAMLGQANATSQRVLDLLR